MRKKCNTCTKSFIVTIDRTLFCCHKCQARWAIKLYCAARKPKPFKGKNLLCITCKKEYYVPQYRIKNSKYCSRSCLAKIHLKQFSSTYGFKKIGNPLHKYKCVTIDGKRIREHRYIMEKHLGRKLKRWEHVHHMNDDSSDNRIENLEVLSNSEHQKKELLFRKKLWKARLKLLYFFRRFLLCN